MNLRENTVSYSVQLFLMSNLLWPGSVQRRTQGRGGGYCDSAPLDQWNTRFPGGVMAPLRRRKNVKPALDKFLSTTLVGVYSLYFLYNSVSTSERRSWLKCVHVHVQPRRTQSDCYRKFFILSTAVARSKNVQSAERCSQPKVFRPPFRISLLSIINYIFPASVPPSPPQK